MGWRGYIDDDRKAVFFWSQKAACTTLFRVLADNMAEPPEKKKHFHTESVPYWRCRPKIDDEGYRAVILVRHPTLRAISAYFNKFVIYRGKPLKRRADLESFSQDLHDRYVTRTGADPQANTMTFEDYLDTVEALMANRPRPGHPVNGHWDTQAPEALIRDPDFGYDHIVRVEHFARDMRGVGRALGLKVKPKRENPTEVSGHGSYLGAVPAREVAEYPFGYADFLSARNLEQIARIYAIDFEAFGYDPDPRRPGGPLAPKPAGLGDRLKALLGR
ncbi:Sulfotransferase family protein [Roseivivax marinus]|uniref:sulfotransferase family 2 domain-containing protein n=1 Tax=Roseivivax marinus TaxID=1379903 RepID=UPI0008C48C9E|nr:sulfotransferase family 2 domain-containing protein [Roseivivax marinus]SEL72132.1 Sulfotransferase family protein [Roseivivax marinus]